MYVAVHMETRGKRQYILFQNTNSGETLVVTVGKSDQLDYILKELEVVHGDKFIIEC